jgi:hypothetical protein
MRRSRNCRRRSEDREQPQLAMRAALLAQDDIKMFDQLVSNDCSTIFNI